MPERSSDLEIFRDKFMHELGKTQPDLANHQDFLKYWRMVEGEAQQTEDLGELDAWVRDLARDRERVTALKNRTDTMTSKQGAAPMQALTQILKQVLDVLDAIYHRLRRLRDERFSALASMLWKGGPGTTPKPKDEKDKKDGKPAQDKVGNAEENAPAAVAKTADPQRDKEKKLDR